MIRCKARREPVTLTGLPPKDPSDDDEDDEDEEDEDEQDEPDIREPDEQSRTLTIGAVETRRMLWKFVAFAGRGNGHREMIRFRGGVHLLITDSGLVQGVGWLKSTDAVR